MRMYKLDPFKIRSSFFNLSGFTLIEVLIAIALLSFISLYTYKMIDNSTDTKDRVLKEDQLLLQTLTAMGRLDSDFSQIYSPLYSYPKVTAVDTASVYQDNSPPKGGFDGKAKNGEDVPQFQSEDKSALVFFTSSNRRKIIDTKESRYTWVKYSMRRSDNSHSEKDERDLNTKGENELIRQTFSSNIYGREINWQDIKAQVLLTRVKSIEYSFWDERSKKFVTSIQELNENKNIIRSIKLNLVWIDENNHEQKIEKTFRVLYPFFNTKVDDMKNGNAHGGGPVPPGLPDLQDTSGQGGESEKHF